MTTICHNATQVLDHRWDSFVDGYMYNFHYSWDAVGETVSPRYFSIENQSIRINLFPNDLSFKKGSNTDPRSELRLKYNIEESQGYIVTYDSYLDQYPNEFDCCFFQIHGGREANMMFRYRDGKYQIANLDKHKWFKEISGSPYEDIGVWRKWRFEFKISEVGYFIVYRDDVLLGSYFGNTSAYNANYIKYGLYRQHTSQKGVATVFIRNFKLFLDNGTL